LAGGGKFNNCKMEEIVKYNTDGNVTEVTKDDLDDIVKCETLACHAVHEAIHNMHRKCIPTVHIDEKGIYKRDSIHGKRYLKRMMKMEISDKREILLNPARRSVHKMLNESLMLGEVSRLRPAGFRLVLRQKHPLYNVFFYKFTLVIPHLIASKLFTVCL
jgi:hypothetical protein